MKRKPIKVKIMIVAPPSQSDSESDTDGESVSDVFKELKEQMAQIEQMAKALDTEVVSLYKRATAETVDWMNEPLQPRSHIVEWCADHGLPEKPTINEFTDACFAAAKSMDMESRIITFRSSDAAILWGGQRRVSVFEVVRRIPNLFE